MEDGVNHPSWYNAGRIEALDYIVDKNLDFVRGSIVKYITRAGLKDVGTELEDLKKARFYIDWEIKRLESQKGENHGS